MRTYNGDMVTMKFEMETFIYVLNKHIVHVVEL
jgi:hypothetical protein